jgi:hypothetical protein
MAPIGVALLALATRRASAVQGALLGLVSGLACFLPSLSWSGIYVGALPWVALAVLESLLQDVREAGGTITDEISLLIRSGGKARVVEYPDWNIKVTYPRDLELAEMILERRRKHSAG